MRSRSYQCFDEPLLVGIQDIDVTRTNHHVEAGANCRLINRIRERRTEHDVVARIGDIARAVLLRTAQWRGPVSPFVLLHVLHVLASHVNDTAAITHIAHRTFMLYL